jgi:DNA-binding transcriptional LysR family regulator
VIDLRRLRQFVAVAEHLHFGRAAAALGVSQPPLSRAIKSLEDALGTPLFARTKRSVKLTAAGRALLPEARQLVRQVDALRHGARRLAAGEIGNIVLGFVSSAAYNVLPELLQDYRRRHPGVRLTLQEATSDVQLASLRAGDMDVGLVLPPIDDAALDYVPIFAEPLVAALPASAYRRAPARLPLRSLAQAPFILFPRRSAPGLHDLVVGFCRRAGFSPRVEQEAIQMQTIVSLVAAGMGVALVPASLRHLRRTGVIYRELSEQSPRVEYGLAWRRDNDSPALGEFIALAKKRARTGD